MRNSFIIVAFSLLLVALPSSCQGKLETESSQEEGIRKEWREWLDSLCSNTFMGRKTGSIYDEMAFNYLCETVDKLGYSYSIQEFPSLHGNSILRNIIVELEGTNDKVIVIGAHYDGAELSEGDTHFPAANDNASGVITVLALLDSLKRGGVNPGPSLICALWDGEEVYDGSWAQGSRYFVRSYKKNKDDILFYLNLDSVGHEHALYIKHKGHGSVEEALKTLISNKRLSYVTIDMNDGKKGSSDYVSFDQNDIPYLSFGDHNGDMCAYSSHSPKDMIEAVSMSRIAVHVENIMDIVQ